MGTDTGTAVRGQTQEWRLTRRQAGIVAVVAVGLWFAGALLVRVLGQAGWLGGAAGVGAFALTAGTSWVTVVAIRRIAGLEGGQIVSAMSLGTAIATVFDSALLTWAPGLYGTDPVHLRLGGALILWAGATGLLMSFLAAAPAGDRLR